MDERHIIRLLFSRAEQAIEALAIAYGNRLFGIARNILGSDRDAEECVNDTYIDAWGAMPDARPQFLGAFLSKITRRISIDRYRRAHREKRGGIEGLCEELTDCIPSGDTPFDEYENGLLSEALNSFLASLDKEKRVMFTLRYFYSKSVEEIALRMGIGESKVKTTLFRIRKSLREYLERRELF